MSEKPELPQKVPPRARGLDGTTAFRVMNFELYAKPNRFIMYAGLLALVGCTTYLLKMRQMAPAERPARVTTEDGEYVYERKKSKWD